MVAPGRAQKIPPFFAVTVCVCQELKLQDNRWIIEPAFQYKAKERQSKKCEGMDVCLL